MVGIFESVMGAFMLQAPLPPCRASRCFLQGRSSLVVRVIFARLIILVTPYSSTPSKVSDTQHAIRSNPFARSGDAIEIRGLIVKNSSSIVLDQLTSLVPC